MNPVEPVDVARFVVDCLRDTRMAARERQPGPPQRIDGWTLGIVDVVEDAPHDGEVHPDGDEFLHVISGRMRLVLDSAPGQPLELGPGDSCIVRRGEWHKLTVIEPARLLHVTPGPNGNYRPLV